MSLRPNKEFVEKIAYFKAMQADIMKLATQLDMAKKFYNESVQNYFGFHDGQPLNIVQLFDNMNRFFDDPE